MDAVARILCADGSVRSVFEPALLAELQPSSPLSVSMLRGSSLSTELFYSYSRLVGGKYIRRLLGPVLREVFADKSSLQLDPRHLPAGESKEENVERVRYYVDRIVHSLCAPKAVSTFPQSLREIFHTLRETTLACGHSVDLAQHLEVTFFFSKFVQSAIVKPELYDGSISLGDSALADDSDDGAFRMQEETRNRQKVCVLAKIMGNVIQGVEFSDVEPEYQELNDLVSSNDARNKVRSILHIILRDFPHEKEESMRQDWHATEASIRFLYRCLDSHSDRIRRALEHYDADDDLGFADRFAQLVGRTGKLLRAPSIVETISIQHGTNVRQRFDGSASVLIDIPDSPDVASQDAHDRAKRDRRARHCFGSTSALLSGLPPMCSGCVLS